MADEHVSTFGQPPLSRVLMPELDANARVVPEPAPPLPSNPIGRPATDVSGAPISRANYITRHWRGELSLPVSYWINGFLLSITLYVLSASAVAASLWQLQLFGASLGIVLIPIIAVWQLIGIYRSAKRRVGFWPGMARLCVGFGWLRLIVYVAGLVVSVHSELHQQHAVANHPTPPVAQAPTGLRYTYSYTQDNKLIIHVRGEITKGDVARFPKWVTDNIKNGDKITGVSLDSPGGSVQEALLFAEGIKKTGVPTLVGSGDKCVSACFLIFAAGKRRFSSKEAHIGVHSLVVKGEGENLDAKGSTLDLARTATEKFSIPPSIIGRMVATPPDKVYWLNRSDLAEMGVQIIDDKPTSPPPPAAPSSPEPPARRTTGSESTVLYDPVAEAQKAQLRATEHIGEADSLGGKPSKHRDPPRSGLCPPPYRMTASDGCQK
jgi:hypothetical protein